MKSKKNVDMRNKKMMGRMKKRKKKVKRRKMNTKTVRIMRTARTTTKWKTKTMMVISKKRKFCVLKNK